MNAFVTQYRQAGAASEALASLEQEQACLLRFAHDATRMRVVYAELGKVFVVDDQYGDFLRSAWNANLNYAPFRERIKQAKTIAPKIAEAARNLAKLLDEAGKVGGGLAPPEFYSIRTLLDATDNHELGDHNLHIWPMVRDAITGTTPAREADAKADDEAPAPRRVMTATEEDAEQVQRDNPDALVVVIRTMNPGDAVTHDPKQEARNLLRYAWEKAPGLPALLDTVAGAADDWRPQEHGAIGAAIASRKSTPTAAYIRAFAKLLREAMPALEWSPAIYAAMAGVADVVLNDPVKAVTADGVRQALIRAVDDSA
ncbi:MAG: hypothetical protein JSR26_08470 [Proteobacteria bacterium]|nr:hypothetical protein [Pseudomonadota bacterium]